MKRVIIIILIVVIGFITVLNLKRNSNEFNKRNSFEKFMLYYYEREFEGEIIKKFIDKSDHSSEKIILKDSNNEIVIYLNYESKHIFNKFMKGDSISKKRNSYSIKIIRDGKIDSIKFNFEGYYKRHHYHHDMDTVISNILEKNKTNAQQ